MCGLKFLLPILCLPFPVSPNSGRLWDAEAACSVPPYLGSFPHPLPQPAVRACQGSQWLPLTILPRAVAWGGKFSNSLWAPGPRQGGTGLEHYSPFVLGLQCVFMCGGGRLVGTEFPDLRAAGSSQCPASGWRRRRKACLFGLTPHSVSGFPGWNEPVRAQKAGEPVWWSSGQHTETRKADRRSPGGIWS